MSGATNGAEIIHFTFAKFFQANMTVSKQISNTPPFFHCLDNVHTHCCEIQTDRLLRGQRDRCIQSTRTTVVKMCQTSRRCFK